MGPNDAVVRKRSLPLPSLGKVARYILVCRTLRKTNFRSEKAEEPITRTGIKLERHPPQHWGYQGGWDGGLKATRKFTGRVASRCREYRVVMQFGALGKARVSSQQHRKYRLLSGGSHHASLREAFALCSTQQCSVSSVQKTSKGRLTQTHNRATTQECLANMRRLSQLRFRRRSDIRGSGETIHALYCFSAGNPQSKFWRPFIIFACFVVAISLNSDGRP